MIKNPQKSISDYPDVLQIEDIKEILKVGRSAVYSMLQNGTIKSVRVGRKYIIPKQSILDFLNLKN